jgi:hypothetical protein
VPNKANLSWRTDGGHGPPYKRDRFCGTKPMDSEVSSLKCEVSSSAPPPGTIPAEGGWATWRLTRRAKQSQFVPPDRWCARHTLRTRPILQNKANLTGRGTTIAKLRLTMPPRLPPRILRNKANLREVGGQGSDCANKANLRRTGRAKQSQFGAGGRRLRIERPGADERICETKPILPGCGRHRACGGTSCRKGSGR